MKLLVKDVFYDKIEIIQLINGGIFIINNIVYFDQFTMIDNFIFFKNKIRFIVLSRYFKIVCKLEKI